MYARKRDRQARSAKSGQRDPMKFVLQKLVEIDEGMHFCILGLHVLTMLTDTYMAIVCN